MELQQSLLQGTGPYACPGPPGWGQANGSEASIQPCSPKGAAACPIYLWLPLCLSSVPPSSPTPCCSGENQGSDQHEQQPPGLDFHSPFIFLSALPLKMPAKALISFHCKFWGKSPSLSWPLWMAAASKVGLYLFPFMLLQGLICQKKLHHLHGDKPPSSTTLLSTDRMQPLLLPTSTKQENRAQKTEMRINIQEALVLTPRWRAACQCQEPAVNLTADCWPHTSPDTTAAVTRQGHSISLSPPRARQDTGSIPGGKSGEADGARWG